VDFPRPIFVLNGDGVMGEKLEIPQLQVAESMAGYAVRRDWLLQNTAGLEVSEADICDVKQDIYGGRAIANLVLDRFEDACNARLQRTAQWFDHPHPNDRHHKGECDFAAMKLCRAYYLFCHTDKLHDETLVAIRRFFLTTEFESRHHSENHEFLFHTSRYLMAKVYRDDLFEAYGKTGADLAAEDAEWLLHFIRYRAKRGWGEFDSSCYFQPDWECLISLYDYCGDAGDVDAELHRLSEQMMQVLLVDMAVDSINGMYGGAHGRIYQPHALDHTTGNTYTLQYLYFGNVDRDTIGKKGALIDALVSDFRPHELVVDIALNRNGIYENRERKHLHNCSDVRPIHPVEGSIRKYTYFTPQFILGSLVLQDPYPDDCDGGWYAHHEQHEWDLTIGSRTTARVFTHHPGESGPEHGYWTGDIRCCCGSFFQHKTVVMSLYDIPESQPLQFIHAYLPQASFDVVNELDGFVFVKEGGVYAALKMLNGQQWTREGEWADRELISYGAQNGAICEVGDAETFGSFESFCNEIRQNEYIFNKEEMQLTYVSKRVGTLVMDMTGLRLVDGIAVDMDWPLYDCPYLQSEWDSGVIHILKGDQKLVLDFT
jgi:hypothetical protein